VKFKKGDRVKVVHGIWQTEGFWDRECTVSMAEDYWVRVKEFPECMFVEKELEFVVEETMDNIRETYEVD
jgi:hypothetical protein